MQVRGGGVRGKRDAPGQVMAVYRPQRNRLQEEGEGQAGGDTSRDAVRG